MKRLKITIITSVLTSVCLHAQDMMPINVQSVLELAGANNLTIKEFQHKQEIAHARLTQAGEWWYPQIYTGAKTQQFWGASMNANGTLNTDVSGDNLWLGVGVNATLNFADGIYKTKAAKLNLQAVTYTTQAERNQALLRCVNVYYDMLNEQFKVQAYTDLAAQAKNITDQIDVQVTAGLRYQSELLLAKSNYAHLKLELLNAQSAYRLKSAELVKLLNIPGDVVLHGSESYPVPVEWVNVKGTQEKPVNDNRVERKAVEATIHALEEQKKTVTTGLYLPQLSVDTSTSYFGSLTGNAPSVIPGQGSKQLYPTSGANIALLWKIPFGRLVSGGDAEYYDAQIKTQYVKALQIEGQIKQEISDALEQVIRGQERIVVAKEGLETTVKALNQSIERQKLGTAKPFEVFQAQQFYLQAKIDYFKTVGEYNKAQFAYKVAKGDIL